MPANIQWEIPFLLTTPQGTVPFNTPDTDVGGLYLLNQDACKTGRDARVARDNIPQQSGEILHPHFASGQWMRLVADLWEDEGKIACDELLVAMWDKLMLNLNSIIGQVPVLAADGRIQWTPTGGAARMLNPVRMLDEADATTADNGLVTVTFAVISSRPYAWDLAEIDTALPATVTNTGTDAFYPVIEVHGPTTGFTITNTSVLDQNGNPLALVYDGTRPGAHAIAAGHYLELDFFRNTAYLDGNVANYKPGIDIETSDFFPLIPGANVITVSGYGGTGITMKWQAAFA